MRKHIQKIVNRSGIRECDVCHKPEFLVEHHINGRDIKDANREWNITNICPNCHYNVHLGETIIEGWFMSSDGRILLWHSKGKETITGQEAKPFVIKPL